MLEDKQIQKAGDNSTQFQTQTVNVYNMMGITEERAREIVDEKIAAVISNYSSEAHETARKRIMEFSTVLIPKLVREQLLDSLRDPSVQVLLLEAEKSASSSGRENDYELLSELLVHRVKKGDNRNIMSGINRAVKIVDEISDEALQGLTVAHSIVTFMPISDGVEDVIRLLDSLFSKIIYDDLPTGEEWIEHLDILDAVRISSIGGLKKIEQLYSERLSGFVDVGIRKDSEAYAKSVDILNGANIPLNVLVNHELRKEYVRLKVLNRDKMDLLCFKRNIKMNRNGALVDVPIKQDLSYAQKEALNRIYDLYENDNQLKRENITRFMEIFNSYDTLKKVSEWWDSISVAFSITSVGNVLAYANAQRYDSSIPPMS